MIHLRSEGRETSWASKHGFNTSRFRNHFSKFFPENNCLFFWWQNVCDWSTVLVANLEKKMIQFYVLSREKVYFRKNKIVVQLWTRLTGECLLYSLFWPPFFQIRIGGFEGCAMACSRSTLRSPGHRCWGGGEPLAAKLKKNLEDALLCKSSLSFRISI